MALPKKWYHSVTIDREVYKERASEPSSEDPVRPKPNLTSVVRLTD